MNRFLAYRDDSARFRQVVNQGWMTESEHLTEGARRYLSGKYARPRRRPAQQTRELISLVRVNNPLSFDEVKMTLLPFLILKNRPGICFAIFVALNVLINSTFAMGGYGKENAKLWHELMKSMIENKVCKNENECFYELPIYGYQSDKIYYEIYAPKNADALSFFISFVIKNGVNITGGMPIVIKVYKEEKIESEKYLFKIGLTPFVKLEVRK